METKQVLKVFDKGRNGRIGESGVRNEIQSLDHRGCILLVLMSSRV